MKAEKICYKMGITNYVCRGGGVLNSLNKALFWGGGGGGGGVPLAYS